jgi:hypothetical protein
MPVRIMLMPARFIAAKSWSNTWGFGSSRKRRCTSDAMYDVPVTTNGTPSRSSEWRSVVNRPPPARSAASWIQNPVVVLIPATVGSSESRLASTR